MEILAIVWMVFLSGYFFFKESTKDSQKQMSRPVDALAKKATMRKIRKAERKLAMLPHHELWEDEKTIEMKKEIANETDLEKIRFLNEKLAVYQKTVTFTHN